MEKIILKEISTTKDYPIFIGEDLIKKLTELFDFSLYSKAFVITDKIVSSFYLSTLLSTIPMDVDYIVIPAGEHEKNIINIQKIWDKMISVHCDRKSLVINIGGGVVSDMGGFVAATYMRGVPFINIPTTLLSQVDASVGGKTGIDYTNVKNLIGSFNQPSAVFIDTTVLSTLPRREFLAGFAEIIKHGLILDTDYFQQVTSKNPLDFSLKEMEEIIAKSCKIKMSVIQQDPSEQESRKVLNFGHTIGHAIESLSLDSSNPYLHGEAISIGMIGEAYISLLEHKISEADFNQIKQSLNNANLPVSSNVFNTDQVLERMKDDKKNSSGKINFVLLTGIGTALIDQKVPDNMIIEALEYLQKK